MCFNDGVKTPHLLGRKITNKTTIGAADLFESKATAEALAEEKGHLLLPRESFNAVA
jgi:hypothetical protein